MRELDALQKQQNRKNFACQGAGKLTALGVLLHNSQCCSASLAHTRPTMFYILPSNKYLCNACVQCWPASYFSMKLIGLPKEKCFLKRDFFAVT